MSSLTYQNTTGWPIEIIDELVKYGWDRDTLDRSSFRGSFPSQTEKSFYISNVLVRRYCSTPVDRERFVIYCHINKIRARTIIDTNHPKWRAHLCSWVSLATFALQPVRRGEEERAATLKRVNREREELLAPLRGNIPAKLWNTLTVATYTPFMDGPVGITKLNITQVSLLLYNMGNSVPSEDIPARALRLQRLASFLISEKWIPQSLL